MTLLIPRAMVVPCFLCVSLDFLPPSRRGGTIVEPARPKATPISGHRSRFSGGDPGGRVLFLRQLQAMGRDAGSAIPELEKIVAARADLAGEFAPVIEAIKGK